MKHIPIWHDGKDLNRDSVGKFSSPTRFQRFKRGVRTFFKRVLVVAVILVALYTAGFIGSKLYPSTVYAIKEVPVKDTSLAPILDRIIQCESSGKQFDANGYVLRGKVNPEDWGLAQINVSIWGAKSKELGYDITTEQGNRDMAQWLLENKGTGVWSSSQKCWSK